MTTYYLVSAPQKRGFVAFARKRGLSQRRACRLAGQWRSVARYRARPQRLDETELVERLKQIAQKKRRLRHCAAQCLSAGTVWRTKR